MLQHQVARPLATVPDVTNHNYSYATTNCGITCKLQANVQPFVFLFMLDSTLFAGPL